LLLQCAPDAEFSPYANFEAGDNLEPPEVEQGVALYQGKINTHTTICLRPSSGLPMNLRVRNVTGVSLSAIIAASDANLSECWQRDRSGDVVVKVWRAQKRAGEISQMRCRLIGHSPKPKGLMPQAATNLIMRKQG
jgi:hypothetical protein